MHIDHPHIRVWAQISSSGVVFVYDVLDTEGKDLPEDVASFFARGTIDDKRISSFVSRTSKKNIEWYWVDAGDQAAGSIRVIERAVKKKEVTYYRICINRNHTAAVQFATLAHELGHLFLGHIGPDTALEVPQRPSMDHAQRELEAESVSYLVCARNGVASKSETYLANYVKENTTVDQIDLYRVMRAAGQVEALLGLTAQTKYDRPKQHFTQQFTHRPANRARDRLLVSGVQPASEFFSDLTHRERAAAND